VIDKLKRFIEDKNLLVRQDRLLVAVSSGLDSMVLLHLLKQVDIELGGVCEIALRQNSGAFFL